MRRLRTPVLAGCALVLGVAPLAACGNNAEPAAAGFRVIDDGSSGRFEGTELPTPYTLPTGTFTATDGSRTSMAAAAGPATVVIFAYSHCPDVCSTQIAAAAAALRRSAAEVREKVRFVMITTDPQRDDPTTMRTFLDTYNAEFEGLTAPTPTIEAAAQHLGVAVAGKSATKDGGYTVDHGAQMIGFDSSHHGVVLWQPGVSVNTLKHDLAVLAEAA